MLRLFLFAILGCILFEGCNSFYATAHPQAPLMQGKNDLHTVVNAGFSGINAAASYAPINHLYVGGSLHLYPNHFGHVSGGPHIGYYYNNSDSTFQFNTMFAYTWGDTHYSNPITGQDVSGKAKYQAMHFQMLIAHRGGKRGNNFWGLIVFADPVRLEYAGMRYHYNSPDTLSSEILNVGISYYFQHRLRAAPAFRITWQFGYQAAMSNVGNPDDVTNPVILRLGLIYQFRPGFRRN